MARKPFTAIAGLIFAVMALIHLDRLFTHFRLEVGSHDIPQWVSVVGVAIPAILALGLFREARR
jgi:hypothetical protein